MEFFLYFLPLLLIYLFDIRTIRKRLQLQEDNLFVISERLEGTRVRIEKLETQRKIEKIDIGKLEDMV